MKLKVFLLSLVACVASFAQTPCIDQAKLGKVGTCLTSSSRATSADAKFVATTEIPGYVVYPDLPYSLSLEFATKEQATALCALLIFQYPGSTFNIADTGSSFSFPPFRELLYLNAGGMFDKRVYTVTGTININGVPFQTVFEPGWFINVTGAIYGGSLETQNRFPFGKDKVVAVPELGGASPKWVGNGSLQ